MSDIDHQERLLNLVALLLKARRPVSKHEILREVDGYRDAGEIDAIERKFEHDKNRLANLGITIKYTESSFGHQGYEIDTDASLLPPINLTAEERLILETLTRSYLQRAHGEFASNLRSALFKLMFDNLDVEGRGVDDGDNPENFPLPTASDDDAPAVVGPATIEANRERANLDLFMDAVLARKTVSFKYTRPDSTEAEVRKVDPYGIAFVRGGWYLAGFSHERKGPRVFKLMRIDGRAKKVNELPRPDFDAPENYDVRDTVANLLSPRDEERTYDEVRLHVAPDVSFMVREWVMGQSEQSLAIFTPNADGSGTLALRTPLERTVWQLMANYAPLTRVDSPEPLRDSFRDQLTRIRQKYSPATS